MPIPSRAVATDVVNGDMVVLKNGNLADAMHASTSVLSAFALKVIDGQPLVDGVSAQTSQASQGAFAQVVSSPALIIALGKIKL